LISDSQQKDRYVDLYKGEVRKNTSLLNKNSELGEALKEKDLQLADQNQTILLQSGNRSRADADLSRLTAQVNSLHTQRTVLGGGLVLTLAIIFLPRLL